MVAGAAVTVLLGVKNILSSYETQLSITALILSAAVTVGGSWDSFDDPQWKWIKYRAALHQLFAIRETPKYRLDGDQPLTQEELDEVFERLQTTVKEMDDEWTTLRVELIKTNMRWGKPAGT